MAVIVIALIGLLLSPAWSGPASSRVPQNVLVAAAIISDSNSLDPAQAFEFNSTWTVMQAYDMLVDFNREYTRAVPRLAESWTASADGKTYTFKLRPARFHSGAAVDAKAVEFSIRRAYQLKLAPSFIITDFINSPTDVVAVAPDRVRITFKQVMPEILMASVLANPVTAVVDPALVQKNATSDDPLANRWLSDNDAGSGPYILRGWSRNIKIELQAFDNYWRGRPRMGRIFIQEMQEPAAQLLALRSGDIDVAMNLLPGQVKELAGQAGFTVKSVPTFSLRYLGMNAGYAPFANKNVRNAVKFAIDYDAFKRIWEDTIEIGQTIVPARMFGYLPETPYRRNLDRARQLMREGGQERGFTAELLVPLDPPLPDIAAKIKEDLAQINITVDVRVVRGADLNTVFRAQRHQMVIARWGADYPDPDNLAKAFADFDSRVLAWRSQWDHPVKRMVQQAVAELDRAKRDAMYKEIQKIVLEEGPYAVFAYPLRQFVMRSNVKGFDPSPLHQTYELFGAVKE
jgi:peptide/nickel transport system substrate-binding protein